MKLWFETHSTSVDNEKGIASGHLDPPLSEKGRAQAAELRSRYVVERPVSVVYSSDLRRAVETAAIAFANTGISRIQDRRLRECDYGTWSGCEVKQLDAARLKFLDEPFSGGESFREVVRRVEEFLTEVASSQPGTMLIIGHRAPWYALEHLLRGRDLRRLVLAQWTWQPGWEYDL